MKRAKLAAILSCAILLLAVAGCGNIMNSVGSVVDGAVTKEMGTTCSTEWFDFTVESAKIVPEYAGYAPAGDNMLIDVVVTETATFDGLIPMGTFDFYIVDGPQEQFALPMDPLDDTMMPEHFELAKGDTVTYHLLFEIPDDAEGLTMVYVEVFEDDSEGKTWLIPLSLAAAV